MISMPPQFFKECIQKVRPYEPGKPLKELEREMGLHNIIKLASNENPLGPSRKAVRAMRRAIREAHLYPESKCYYLVRRLSQELGVQDNQIIVGNGSNEIIELLARGFLTEGGQALSSETTFLVYPILSQVYGAEYVSVPMKNFRYDLQAMAAAITERTKIIFIANPNNPTGTYITAKEVEEFLTHIPPHVIVCFDEAYVDFVEARDFPHTLSLVKIGKPNVILLRTFSKSYGLAGVRVGYAVGSKEVVDYLHKIRQPFNVNSIAQAAATAALDDRFFLWRTRHLVSSGRRYLYKRLGKLGLRYLPTEANFILVDVKADANEIFNWLLRQGLIVRSMKAYGLETWIRVTIGRRSQNAQFYRLIKKYLKSRE